MSVEFEDYSIQVKKTLATTAKSVLEEVAGELESQVKRNTRVRTGKTKNSWRHKITKKSDEEITAYIGSDYENTIWEEFGTGDYALNGDGRKGGWFYEDVEGKGHFTHGKEPTRAFWKAYTSMKNKIIARIQNALKEL